MTYLSFRLRRLRGLVETNLLREATASRLCASGIGSTDIVTHFMKLIFFLVIFLYTIKLFSIIRMRRLTQVFVEIFGLGRMVRANDRPSQSLPYTYCLFFVHYSIFSKVSFVFFHKVRTILGGQYITDFLSSHFTTNKLPLRTKGEP